MPITMTCPSCTKPLTAPDSAVGKRAKCPGCAQIMIVPDAVFEAELVGDQFGQHSFPSLGAIGSAAQADSWLGDTASSVAAVTGATTTGADGQSRRPCPECGELIITGAAKCRFCGSIFDPRLRGRSYRALGINLGPPGEYARQIRFCFNLWWIGLAVGLVVVFAGIAAAAAAEEPAFALIAALGGIAILAGGISYLVLLYKLWQAVQDGRAQTTPGCAVGFMFIPCFSFYWRFVAIWGLAKELNRISREYNMGAPKANESLALAECILFCCGIVPYLGAVPMLVGFVISIIAIKDMCNVAVVIAETQNASTT